MDRRWFSNWSFMYLAILGIAILLHLYFSFRFSDVCIMNSGISFGIGADSFGSSTSTLIVANLIIFIGIGCITVKNVIEKNILEVYLYFTLFIVGLLNFTDRVRFGAVCDYISLFNLHFNIPDVIIVIVSALLISQIFYKNYRNDEER